MATLNEQQHKAATSISRRILCLAGAGTGKTRTLTARVKHLTERRIGADSILALTFTRMAGLEMKQRIIKEIGETAGGKLFCNTFHAFALRILREYPYYTGLRPGFTIYDDLDREAVFKRLAHRYMLEVPIKKAMELYALGKSSGTFSKDPAKQAAVQKDYWRLINAYQEAMRDNNAVDLSRIIKKATEVLTMQPEVARLFKKQFAHILVDEYQDTSLAQTKLIEAIDPDNLFVVGDDYQSIYEWRDARPDLILRLADNPEWEVIRLETNYRSTQPILDIANEVIKKNKRRTDKDLVPHTTERGNTQVSVFQDMNDEMDDLVEQLKEAPGVPTAILCRTNAQVQTIAKYAREQGVKAAMISKRYDPLQQAHIRQILHVLQLAVNNSDGHALENTIFRFGTITQAQLMDATITAINMEVDILEVLRVRKYDKFFLDILDEVAKETGAADAINRAVDLLEIVKELQDAGLDNRIEDLYNAIYMINKWEAQQRSVCEDTSIQAFLQYVYIRDIQAGILQAAEEPIKVMTVHTAKGLEFERVFIPQVNRGVFPTTRGDLEEERRLFFVAVTRAERELYISGTLETVNWSGRTVLTKPSDLHLAAKQALLAKPNHAVV